MNNLDNVQKGDIVVYNYGISIALLTVTRVTKTKIVCGSLEFGKDGHNKLKDVWNTSHIYLPTPKQLQEIREQQVRKQLINNIREVDLQHISTNVLNTVNELLVNGNCNYEKKIDTLETEIIELEEQNYEYQDKISNLEYELEKRNSYHSYLIKQLIQLARNNVTPYSQQDNDIWGIQQEIEKIIGVDLND